MAWTNSKVFAQLQKALMDRTTAQDLDTDAFKVALYNNTTTPDGASTLALSAYNAATSAWVVANEVSEATNWPAGGRPLVTPTVTVTGTTIMWDAVDTVSATATTTLANVFGCLNYNDTLAGKYGVCFNYFGGTNSVTNGTFTVVWATAGLASWSVA